MSEPTILYGVVGRRYRLTGEVRFVESDEYFLLADYSGARVMFTDEPVPRYMPILECLDDGPCQEQERMNNDA